MVKQGDIIKIDFDPISGHEQAGYRPALVISNNYFNNNCSVTLVCPISNTKSTYPTQINLDDRTVTTGKVLCQHIRSVDLRSRSYVYVERIPDDLLKQAIEYVKFIIDPME